MFEYLGQIGWIIVKMDFFLILLFFVVLLTSYFVLSKPRGLPPGPPALPFFGCVSTLQKLRSNRPHLVFHEAAKKYGNIVSIKIGRELMIILNGYDVIHQALVKQADSFSNRVNYLPAFKYLLKDGGGKQIWNLFIYYLSKGKLIHIQGRKFVKLCSLLKGVYSIRKEWISFQKDQSNS